MKQVKASNKALFHIICCVIIIIIFVITSTRVKALEKTNFIQTDDLEEIPLKFENKELLELKRINIEEASNIYYNKPRIVEKNINYYLEQNKDMIKFYSNVFGYDYDYIISDLTKKSKDTSKIEETNLASIIDENGNLLKYKSTEYGLLEYFYKLLETDNNRTEKYIPYTKDSDYVEKLIKHYTQIYANVDSTLALSIGAAESGYYKVTYMLKQNNIYGGMSYSGLIRYNNIELGVLTYVRMLSKNYIEKGLTTVEQIGRVYCPTINESGYKVASPHWINLVNTAKNKYKNYTEDITIDEIIELQNS